MLDNFVIGFMSIDNFTEKNTEKLINPITPTGITSQYNLIWFYIPVLLQMYIGDSGSGTN